MLNKVILMGRITADPELKQTPNGVSVTTFSLAVERSYSGKGTERQTDFINCVAWRNTAEFISRYFTKGKMMAVEGSLQVRSYEDRNGNKRTATEVVVDQAHFAGDSGASKPQQPTTPTPAAPISFSNGSFEDFEELDDNGEDLPF